LSHFLQLGTLDDASDYAINRSNPVPVVWAKARSEPGIGPAKGEIRWRRAHAGCGKKRARFALPILLHYMTYAIKRTSPMGRHGFREFVVHIGT
jgi:hypothetical protein